MGEGGRRAQRRRGRRALSEEGPPSSVAGADGDDEGQRWAERLEDAGLGVCLARARAAGTSGKAAAPGPSNLPAGPATTTTRAVQGAARLKVGGGCRGRRTSRWLRMVPGCRSIGSPSSTSARADCDETPVSVCACSTPGETWSTPKRHPSPQAYRASRNSRC